MRRLILLVALLAAIASTLSVTRLTPAAYSALGDDQAMHTIFREEEDATQDTVPTKTRFEGYYTGTATNPYVIDLDFEEMAGTGSTGGFITFRETDPNDFYQLNINRNSLAFEEKVGGVYTTVATNTNVGYLTNNTEYRLRLVLSDYTFTVYERDVSLTNPVLQWTDPDSNYAAGWNVSYYAKPGNDVCWTKVQAYPTTSNYSQQLAWNLSGVGTNEGYTYTSQTTGGTDVNIGNSRYDVTFTAYDESGTGYGAMSQYQGGQDGAMEYSFSATGYGAEYAYRVTSVNSTTHAPQSGYAVRQTSTDTEWGTLSSTGTFTAVATGPAEPLNTKLIIDVDANGNHTVKLADGTVVISSQTNTTYNGIRAMVGFFTGTGVMHGYQEAK